MPYWNMAKKGFLAGATFRLVRHNGHYGVEVKRPGAAPYVVHDFNTKVEAEDWIKRRRKETEIR
jgi:hypothetical protein